MKTRQNDKLKQFLDLHYKQFNAKEYLDSYPDPLQIAYQNRKFAAFDELCLICALYAYGNASMIVKNLANMPFYCLLDSTLMDSMPLEMFPYYRFQTRMDTKNCLLVISDMIKKGGVKELFLEAYRQRKSVLDGIRQIERIAKDYIDSRSLNTSGLQFLFGNPDKMQSPRKRYNMFLRWMVRCDNLDFGLWREVGTDRLLLPLDTHTFRISKMLGLCQTKTYNFRAVEEITNTLKSFDSRDPIKYDFALYRIGQLGLSIEF